MCQHGGGRNQQEGLAEARCADWPVKGDRLDDKLAVDVRAVVLPGAMLVARAVVPSRNARTAVFMAVLPRDCPRGMDSGLRDRLVMDDPIARQACKRLHCTTRDESEQRRGRP